MRVQRGINCGSDRYVVRTKVYLSIRGRISNTDKHDENISKTYLKHNLDSFQHESPKNLYNIFCLHLIKTQKRSNIDCPNYKGISVKSVMSRLYGKVLRDLIQEENKDEEEQSGFPTGRSCTDSIFCMKQVIEKRNATN